MSAKVLQPALRRYIGDTKGPHALYDTAGELSYNKPPYNKVLSLTNDILHPSNRKVYGTGDNETSFNIENILALCYNLRFHSIKKTLFKIRLFLIKQ